MKKNVIIFLLFIGTHSLFAQTVEDRVENLEITVEQLKNQKENLDKSVELDLDKLSFELDRKFETNKQKVDDDLLLFRIMLACCGIGLIAFPLYLVNYAKKKAEERIDNIVKDKEGELIDLIKSQEVETQVKKNSKILVISETEDDVNYMEDFFTKAKISNIAYRVNQDYVKPDKTYDLIIFDDRQVTRKRHDLFREYMEQLSNNEVLFIFFGDRFQAASREKINFANSKFTLYSQIVNSLKFKEIMK